MNKFIEELEKETTKAYTQNGALTYSTSLNRNVDFFFSMAAMKNASYHSIVSSFIAAYTEDPKIAMANLWYLRDIRNGAGVKRCSEIIYRYLAENHPEELDLSKMVEYGRWKDIMFLLETTMQPKVIDFIKKQFDEDMKAEHPSLMAKWLPSYRCHNESRHNQSLILIARLFKCSKHYRKTLKALRTKLKIVEHNISEKNYKDINYNEVPSRAMYVYSKAFNRNDGERFSEYLENVKKGTDKINTSTLTPVDIVSKYITSYGSLNHKRPENEEVLDTLWNNLKDVYGDKTENSLVIADTSGSMCSGTPMALAISISLAMYMAERNKGAFHNYFMTFSNHPILQKIVGNTIYDKLRSFRTINVSNTDLMAAFSAILDVAVKNNLSQDEMPEKLYIISDMEFDDATSKNDKTNFEAAKQKFAEAGYVLPQIVFWNVDAKTHNVPVRFNEEGVALISGFSVNILKSILKMEKLNPYDLMMKALTPYL